MAKALADQKILLTGCSRGVGRASAELLLEQGAHVLGVARDPQRLERTQKELQEVAPDRFSSLCLDISKKNAAHALFEHISDKWGALDIAVFNAGVMLPGDGNIMEVSEEVVEQTLQTNLMAPWLSARALLPLLLRAKRPRVLNVGSGAGSIDLMTDDGIAAYRLSKWSLHGMTMLEAQALRGKVSINAFDPGWIHTDLGGPNAPGTPREAARGLLATLALPWEESGKFYKDGKEIPW